MLLCLELGLKQPLSEKYVLQSTMQLPAILCIIIIRFKRLENCEGLRSRVWGGCSNLQVLLGRLCPGPRAEGDETDGLQRKK